MKGERGGRISAKEEALQAFEHIGFIHDLHIISGESVSFCFRDVNTRSWLRDVGSVLELYVYKACLDAGFDRIMPLINPTMVTTEAIKSVTETARKLIEEIR